MTKTKLLGCFPEDKLLEDRVLECKRTHPLSENQLSEFENVDHFDMYSELIALREILNQEQNQKHQEHNPKRQKKEEPKNMLQIIEKVHARMVGSLIDASTPGCDAVVSIITQGGINALQKMRDDIIRQSLYALQEEERSN
jgi:hypothetical protein